ncbi:MAG: hypothetical protein QME81_10420 [bacterium]|nr:hypothetical protein [bacterium]
MKEDKVLIERIVSEINLETGNLLKLKEEYQGFIEKYVSIDRYLLRSKASILADFYSGVERVFEIIAEEINGGISKGEHWHKRLLRGMSIEIENVRPPVISSELYNNLLKFLGFRHVVRQAYGFQLDEEKLEELTSIFEETLDAFVVEIRTFCKFLRDSIF